MSRIASSSLAPLFRTTLTCSLLLTAFALAGCASSGSRDSNTPTPTNPGAGTPTPTLPGENGNTPPPGSGNPGGGNPGGGNPGGGNPGGGNPGGGNPGGGNPGGGNPGGGNPGGGNPGGGNPGGGNPGGGNPGGGADNGGGITQTGAVETLLGNTGTLVDNLAGTHLGGSLGELGNSIDTVVEPVLTPLTQLTQRIGADTGLGAPLNEALDQTGNLLGQAGQALGASGLPLNLDSGAEGLLTGLGDTVASLGGLLHATPDQPMPLATTLGHATGAVDALTSALIADGGLLQPLAAPLQNLTATLMPPGQTVAILEPALGNTGAALDNLVPLNLNSVLGNTGAVLDQAVAPVGTAVAGLTQQIGTATGLAQPADQLLSSLGNALDSVGGQLDQALPVGGLGNLVQQVGAGIASAGGLLNPDHPQAENPLGAALGHITSGVSALTSGLASIAPPGQAVAILEPALGNTGAALDNLAPLNLNSALGNAGAALDQAVAPVGAAVAGLTQQIGTATGLAQPADQVLGSLGSALETVGGQLDQTLPIGGLGNLVQQVGAGVASAGGILNPAHPQAENPLGATLGHITNGVAELTSGLTSGLVQGLGNGLTGAQTDNPQENAAGGLGGLLGGLGILNR